MRFIGGIEEGQNGVYVAVCIQVYIGFRMKKAWDFLM